MSVQVSGLTKIYSGQEVVKNLSFTANPGEILGFLGPNGAGKSTTLKMVCSYLEPTEGNISVCGIDRLQNPLEAKKKIGYLPEANPLYTNMYVVEYLQFVAKLRKVPNAKNRITQLIEETGLLKEKRKKIHQLSKGYKQRVGIAQALIHDPEVLILDEPTAGLDPNQLVEIRSLIKQLGAEKTLIFSSHIMQEVEALCDKVIIINNGTLVGQGSIDEIQHQLSGHKTYQVRFDKPINPQTLATQPGIFKVTQAKDGYLVQCATGAEPDEIFRYAVDNNLIIRALIPSHESIEDVFRQLTR